MMKFATSFQRIFLSPIQLSFTQSLFIWDSLIIGFFVVCKIRWWRRFYEYSKICPPTSMYPMFPTLAMVLYRNKLDDDSLLSMFGFVNKYLEPNGYIVLFHKDSPRVAKNIRSLLENNNFKILWHWSMVNNLQHSIPKFISKKVIYSIDLNSLVFVFHHSSLTFSIFFTYYV